MAATGWKFGWKRKIGDKVSQDVSTAFGTDAKDDHEDMTDDRIDWLSATKSRRMVCLEDALAKSKRLKDEGSLLAESERYWEAIKKWDEALHYSPKDATIFEMKAQALMILCEVYPAVKTAKEVIDLQPNWWIGHQTLGRAQLNLGEVRQAVVSFSKAVHLNPADSELWKEDLHWACSLLARKTLSADSEKKTEKCDCGVRVTELDSTDSLANNQCDSECDQTSVVSSYTLNTSQKPHEAPRTLNTLPANYVLMRD